MAADGKGLPGAGKDDAAGPEGRAAGAASGPIPEHLGAEVAAAVLRELLSGKRSVQAQPGRRPLTSVAVGEWSTRAGDAELVFFVHSASLDHLARMRLGDGREAGFGDWLMRDGVNPLELIEEDDRLALEQILRVAG